MKSIIYTFISYGVFLTIAAAQTARPINKTAHFECVDRCYFYEIYIPCYPPNCPPPHADPSDIADRPLDDQGRAWYRVDQDNPPLGYCICDISEMSGQFMLAEWWTSQTPEYEYWPFHLCLNSDDFSKFQNFQNIDLGGNCEGLLDWDETTNCFTEAGSKWNSICQNYPQTKNLELKCEFDTFGDPCPANSHKVEFASNRSDFTNDPDDETWLNVAAQVTWEVWQGNDPIPPNNGKFVIQRAPDFTRFKINISEQWYNPPVGKRRAWTSHCPINQSECEDRVLFSLCQIMLHEMGHIFGLRHLLPKDDYPIDGCPYWFEDEDDGIFGNEDIMGRYYDGGFCNFDLSLNDLCYFCKLHCPDACNFVTSVASEDIVNSQRLEVYVYPNPTNNIVTIRLNSDVARVWCTLIDAAGRIRHDFGAIELPGGLAQQSFNLKQMGISRGTYMLVYHDGNDIMVLKTIILQ